MTPPSESGKTPPASFKGRRTRKYKPKTWSPELTKLLDLIEVFKYAESNLYDWKGSISPLEYMIDLGIDVMLLIRNLIIDEAPLFARSNPSMKEISTSRELANLTTNQSTKLVKVFPRKREKLPTDFASDIESITSWLVSLKRVNPKSIYSFLFPSHEEKERKLEERLKILEEDLSKQISQVKEYEESLFGRLRPLGKSLKDSREEGYQWETSKLEDFRKKIGPSPMIPRRKVNYLGPGFGPDGEKFTKIPFVVAMPSNDEDPEKTKQLHHQYLRRRFRSKN